MNHLPDEPATLHMTARVWAGIDAGIDNVVSLAAVDGDEQAVRIGRDIRQAGWDQVPWVNGDWPPFDQIIAIRLTRAQWQFAADNARESIPIYEELQDEKSAQLCRDALATIEAGSANRCGHVESELQRHLESQTTLARPVAIGAGAAGVAMVSV
ncbi:hypothetical protein [Amycolatopsis sp. NPDC059657]|uniref:hypothetical protein n=1 Tax=Amycolatopsis sp. NPDC059657 TaxID=3346899 RepID=UPI003672DA45